MECASQLRVVPVGASDEEFTTQVQKDSAILILQFIGQEGKLRILGGEHNSRWYWIAPNDEYDPAGAWCDPGGEVAIPLSSTGYVIEESG